MTNLVTIITPTYNRKLKLKELYKSLIKQNSYNFEWVIVDDGSTDGTNELVQSFIANTNQFRIKYFYEKNGGKHRALNLGIKHITSELTFIVDSDDRLTTDAVSSIERVYVKNRNKPNFGGIAFLRENDKGELLINKKPDSNTFSSYVSERLRHGIVGDMAEVWLTKLLKENPFPEFKNEKFLSEDVVWIKISGKSKLVFVNKVIYKANYLRDGLTKNRRRNNWLSPVGCMYKGQTLLTSESIPWKLKIKGALYFNIYGFRIGYGCFDLIKKSNRNIYVIISLIPARIIYLKWKRDYCSDRDKYN
jgi:glycosyltransferase involved in cell wall biosynthesis